MTDDEIKAECEKAFQNGHDRNIIVNDRGHIKRSCPSGRLVLALVEPLDGERVFARRKQRNGKLYVWVQL